MRDELTPTEASKALGVGRLYIYELLASSRLKARKVLGRWLIPRREVESYRRRNLKLGRKRNQSNSTDNQRVEQTS